MSLFIGQDKEITGLVFIITAFILDDMTSICFCMHFSKRHGGKVEEYNRKYEPYLFPHLLFSPLDLTSTINI